MTSAGEQVYREQQPGGNGNCILTPLPAARTPRLPGTMKLVLSVAVIFIALFVMTDAAENPTAEPGLSQKLEKFKQEVQAFVNRFGEKMKAALREAYHGEFSNKTRDWFADKFQKLKEIFKTKTAPTEGKDGA
ncbi:apolipoprotein C-I [Hemicordylus capensis]|uniref:apolipoprotein C-I n=1 Tax=Hemicordylus capensis TaxID=884348 RepID=UPI002303378A|nr:apolipoprotein C-I [Hemicordylus capensis]